VNSRFVIASIAIALALFLAMVLFLEIGRRLGLHDIAKRGKEARAGVGIVDSAVYSLLALLLGFAFASATGRFEKRRDLVAEEANVMTTAWERIDMLPAAPQPAIRAAFKNYLDALLASYQSSPGSREEQRNRTEARRAQNELWTRSVAASVDPSGEKARMLLLPSLSETFHLVRAERVARHQHPPLIVYGMIGIAALAAALFAGYGIATAPGRSWLYVLGVAATVSAAVYVIIELESPRLGLVRADTMNRYLVELRQTMDGAGTDTGEKTLSARENR
jgi:hypothetical protein